MPKLTMIINSFALDDKSTHTNARTWFENGKFCIYHHFFQNRISKALQQPAWHRHGNIHWGLANSAKSCYTAITVMIIIKNQKLQLHPKPATLVLLPVLTLLPLATDTATPQNLYPSPLLHNNTGKGGAKGKRPPATTSELRPLDDPRPQGGARAGQGRAGTARPRPPPPPLEGRGGWVGGSR